MADRFVDSYLPDAIPGFPCISTPMWSTQLVRVDSGDEQANSRWSNPLYRFILPEAIRDMAQIQAVLTHWQEMRGPFHTWPFKDPMDFASVAVTENNTAPTLSSADQMLGTGDGAKTQFQLVKVYGSTNPLTRTIYLPRAGTVLVEANGVDPATLSPPNNWTVSRPGGVITFDSPITAGHVVKAGFLFDNEVRFESDDAFDAIAHEAGLGGEADLTMIGVRRCA